jgi:hypothetical protein
MRTSKVLLKQGNGNPPKVLRRDIELMNNMQTPFPLAGRNGLAGGSGEDPK